MRAIIWAACSTDEKRQDVELQLKPCEDYCKQQAWEYDIVTEYASRYKSVPEKLQRILDLIAQGVYQVIVVYSMDRFSRLKPSITEKMLSHITECKCRFISILERLDSDNPMIWYSMKGIWIYFANLYSQNLSTKIKAGMAAASAKGKPIGRPHGSKDKKTRAKKGYYNRKYNFKLNSN
jgi:DNA invertase Pin-like site-specific DNA recombinase